MKTHNSFQYSLTKSSESGFQYHALELFKYQAKCNRTYNQYLKFLNIEPTKVNFAADIPFMPIEFFKSAVIKTNEWQEETVFESSGTTGNYPSRHYVRNLGYYQNHTKSLFEHQFGRVKDWTILALLPSYLERQGSSLIAMVDYLIRTGGHPDSGFYLGQLDELVERMEALRNSNTKVMLFGVSFAVLELAEKYKLDLSHVTLVETGGMKGRRVEPTRDELYQQLRKQLNFQHIYSEYGMTELFSQAYGLNGRFKCPESMKLMIRDINDPFSYVKKGRTGGVNVIDLANFDTCSFIETKDMGRAHMDGTIEILGRFDNSELRGCNLLVV